MWTDGSLSKKLNLNPQALGEENVGADAILSQRVFYFEFERKSNHLHILD